MERILTLYHLPYDPQRPMICFDEQNLQLLKHTRVPLPVQPGHPRREDHEYKRNSTRNVFMFAEPKAGKRHTLVTRRRTKQDFAYAIRYLVDTLYPDAACIDVVLDNLNTHTYHALVETFGKTDADRIWQRLCFHYTPSHGSWLNMAEIELSVMTKQCLKRRLPDEWSLALELIAWENAANASRRPIHWSFTVEDARRVFADCYPSSLAS
jgi:hypothetical protein